MKIVKMFEDEHGVFVVKDNLDLILNPVEVEESISKGNYSGFYKVTEGYIHHSGIYLDVDKNICEPFTTDDIWRIASMEEVDMINARISNIDNAKIIKTITISDSDVKPGDIVVLSEDPFEYRLNT